MSEATVNAFLEAIYWHICLCALLPIFPLINLLALLIYSSHTKRLKTLALCAPAYYSVLSAVILTGFVVWAMLGFIVNSKITFMLLIWLIVLAYEIKRYKQQKLIKVEADSKRREVFFSFAKRKYCFDLLGFLFLFTYAYGF